MNLSVYKKVQKLLLATFCLSAAVFAITVLVIGDSFNAIATNGVNANANYPSPTPANGNTTTANVNSNPAANTSKPADEQGGYGLLLIGSVTFLTSVTSLLGFISTTVLAWRKEKRETEVIRFDNEKKALELEKLKWELEKMKAEEKQSKPKRARRPKKPE